MRASALCIVLALLPLGSLVANAQGTTPVPSLVYELRLPEPALHLMHVTVDATGLPEGPLELRFPGAADPSAVRNASWGQGILVAQPLDGSVRIEFDVPFAARSGAFALARLDAAIPKLANASLAPAEMRVDIVAPAGWQSAAPVGMDGLVVFARDLRVESRIVAGTRITLASIAPIAAEDWGYLEAGVPHVAAQHGLPPTDVLVVRGPPEALREPVTATPAVALATDASVEELARGIVRLHQRYRVVEVAPASAAWLREGEERYHAATSLLAAGLRTAAETEETVARARAIGDPNATLPQAPAGSITARQKGLIVVRALDTAMRNVSGGRVGVADLLADLDARATPEERIDSAGIEAAAERVAGVPLDDFFAAYVYGPQWPATVPIARGADIFVRDLRVEPARAASGEQVLAQFDAVNRGTQSGAVELVVTLDGESAGSTVVPLDVGERATASAPIVATEAGDHVIRVGPLQTTYRVLAAARLQLDRVSTTPAEPVAGEPFTLLVYVRNDGEVPARGSVEVREDGQVLQRATPATIAGGATRAITLPMRLDEAGLHALSIELNSTRGTGELSHDVNVLLAGAQEEGTPGLGALAAVGVLATLAALRRRRS